MDAATISPNFAAPKLRCIPNPQTVKSAISWLRCGLLLAAAGLLGVSSGPQAQASPHLTIIQPGGFPGWPVMTGVLPGTNSVTVTWDGPGGYYQLFQKRSLTDATWQALGKATNFSRTATVAPLSGNAFFRVTGPSPQYAGAPTCAECHQSTLATVVTTPHAGAFTNALFLAYGGQTNKACLVCHTVGAGLPTGFSTKVATPQLTGVQCENCHGPAANHAANPGDPLSVPRVELAGTVCGGCHNAKYVPVAAAASHPPLYEEWNSSAHRDVVPSLQQDFANNNNISSCGRCHSGSVREAFMDNEALPSGQDAAAIGITCATCHEPHGNNTFTNRLSGVVVNPISGIAVTNNVLGAVYTNQLRYALASTNDYFLTTSQTFTNNPDINICAQCHNHRGASWQSTSRSPHHSPQYNILLGTVGVLDGTNNPASQPATHAFFEMQCVRCHMQTSNYVSPQQPGSAGHTWELASFNTCLGCHPSPSVLVDLVQQGFNEQIQYIKSELDLWASTKAPPALYTNYGTRAWEYTTPGDLSPGGPGPNSNEQALIPVNIQKARFDLYIVLYDGSYGVHNGPYQAKLLNQAQTWVEAELNQ